MFGVFAAAAGNGVTLGHSPFWPYHCDRPFLVACLLNPCLTSYTKSMHLTDYCQEGLCSDLDASPKASMSQDLEKCLVCGVLEQSLGFLAPHLL